MLRDPGSSTIAERVYQKFLIVKQLEGFVAIVDLSAIMYVEKLLELYLDTTVITTVRDEKK